MALYKMLNVSPTATELDIKKAFKQLAMVHHPDKTGSDSEDFRQIASAYRILSDASTRSVYDATLVNSSVPVHMDLTPSDFHLEDEVLVKSCRCGGAFSANPLDFQPGEPILLPCDTCSLFVRVWVVNEFKNDFSCEGT